jgi:Protein of unknown function (DUF2909)
MQTLIVFLLLIIIASLGSALFYLLKDPNRSPRTVKALTFRIGMSFALFLFLLLGYKLGILRPHGLQVPGRGAPSSTAVPPATPDGAR